MSSRWKPGDVAIVRNRWGVENVAVCSLAAGIRGFVWKYGVSDTTDLVDDPARDARPLVVIDPEDREQVSRLADAFCLARWSHLEGSSECDPLTFSSMEQALREFANPKPPKPAEPTGLGAVVEDADGTVWVRAALDTGGSDDDWRQAVFVGTGMARQWFYWKEIDAVRVLSEGVTA